MSPRLITEGPDGMKVVIPEAQVEGPMDPEQLHDASPRKAHESPKLAKQRISGAQKAIKVAKRNEVKRQQSMIKSAYAEIESFTAADKFSQAQEAELVEQARILKEEHERMVAAQERARVEGAYAEAKELDSVNSADPEKLSALVVFSKAPIVSGAGQTGSGLPVVPKGRSVYRFHVPRETGTVGDLKLSINMDYGYEIAAQHIYHLYVELSDATVLSDLPDWSDDHSVLHFDAEAGPVVPPDYIYRPLQASTDILSIATSNSRIDEVPSGDNAENEQPLFRQWAAETVKVGTRLSDNDLAAAVKERAARELMMEFHTAAKEGVQAIQSGKIKPIALPESFGLGGEKYVTGGIIFRKAAKWNVGGEDIGEGDSAFRHAAKELAGLDALRAIAPANVHVPMAALIDSFGTRYLAMAFVPLSPESVVYGSSTNGHTIMADGGPQADVISKLATELNLKTHVVNEKRPGGGQRALRGVPVTFEMHRGSGPGMDYIVCGAARLAPTDLGAVSESVDNFTNLLRPEFTVGYGADTTAMEPGWTRFATENPAGCDVCGDVITAYEYYSYDKYDYDVCSDCLSGNPSAITYPTYKLKKVTVPESERVEYWKNDESGEIVFEAPVVRTPLNPDGGLAWTNPPSEDVDELKAASVALVERVIPEMVAEWEAADDTTVRTPSELTEAMHGLGINMRYLGVIAKETKLSHYREMTVREMIARTVKVLIRDGLHFQTSDQESDARAVIVNFLNQVFSPVETEKSLTLWRYIEELVFKKFGYSLEEKVGERLYKVGLLHAIAEKVGFSLASYADYDFTQDNPFALEDVLEVKPRVKAAPWRSEVLERATAAARAKDEAGQRSQWNIRGGPERAEATGLYREALAIASNVYGGEDSMPVVELMIEFAEHLESRHVETGNPEWSKWNRAFGVAKDELCAEATTYNTKVIDICTRLQGHKYSLLVAEAHVALARLAKDDVSQEDVVAHLQEAVDITETVLGFSHPETAEKYTWLAMQLGEFNQHDTASPLIRKAFVVVYTIFGADHPITETTYGILMAVEMRMPDGLDKVPKDQLVGRIEALAFGEEESSDDDEDDDGEDEAGEDDDDF